MENGSVFILSGQGRQGGGGVGSETDGTAPAKAASLVSPGTGRGWSGVPGGRAGCRQKELGLELSGKRLRAGLKQGFVLSDGRIAPVCVSVGHQVCSPRGSVRTLMLRALFCVHLRP